MKVRSFLFYDPYLSFQTGSSTFVDTKGKEVFSNASASYERRDILDLWLLGNSAYSALGPFASREEFDTAFKDHLAFIDGIKAAVTEGAEQEKIQLVVRENPSAVPDVQSMESADVLDVLWQLRRIGELELDYLQGHFLFACSPCARLPVGCFSEQIMS